MPIIQPDDILAMSLVITGLAWLGFWVDRTRVGRIVAGPVWVIIGAGLLSNTGIIALTSPVYEFVGTYIVPLSIPLLLFKANLRNLLKDAGPVLLLFLVAAVATLAGVLLGYGLFDLGEHAAQLAGVYAGGWIGGAMNMVAVSEAVEMPKEVFAVAISAGSPVSILALLSLLLLPTLPIVQRFCRSAADTNASDPREVQPVELSPVLRSTDVLGALSISLAVCVAAGLLAGWLGIPQFTILLITTLIVVLVNLTPRFFDRIDGAFDLGMMCMYLFFAIIGAGTDLTILASRATAYVGYGLLIIITHLVIMLLATRLFRWSLPEVIVASGAALVGPAATAAVASARGWQTLITPGVVCGVLGYVIANFIGVSLVYLLS